LIHEEVFDGLAGFGERGAFVVVIGGKGIFLEGAKLVEEAEVGGAELALVAGEEEKGILRGVFVEGVGEGLAGEIAFVGVEVEEVALGILQIQGYNVSVVNNGREALEAHAQGDFDLILMDCHMPEMDGFEATKKIRERERQADARPVPIIALTANAMTQDREECLNAGMDDHLSKPFSMQTMKDVLARWMPQAASSAQSAAAELAARATAKAAQVLDRRTLDELRTLLTDGKAEVLTRVIHVYLAESPKLVQALKQAVGADDARQIATCAHSLKSCSANVGAKMLSRYCEDLEASARHAETKEAGKLFGKIESEHGCVQTALTTELKLLAESRA